MIAQEEVNCVRKVDGDGTMSVVAGRCDWSEGTFSGDGGPATEAFMSRPRKLAVMPDGGFLVTDGGGYAGPNMRVRRVWPDGTITTVAGNGLRGSTGDGGPATAATFTEISDVAVDPVGGFLIADKGAARVRRVAPDGTITTVAGTGFRGFSGDGGPATRARTEPVSVEPYRGGFLVSDDATGRIRRVFAGGTIDTVAGAGEVACGVRALDASPLFAENLRVLPGERVLAGRTLFAGPSEPRLLVGLPARPITYTRAVLRGSDIPVAASRAASVVVKLKQRGTTVLGTSRSIPAGRSTVRLPGRFKPPKRGIRGLWRLTVTARSGTAVATAREHLFSNP